MESSRTRRRNTTKTAPQRRVPHRHLLYTAAVQSVETDLDFMQRVYRKERGGQRFRRLREDFCGTAALACEWVRRNPKNWAWGVDLDRATLDWGQTHYVPRLGRAARRLRFLCSDVLEVREPKVDVVVAQNFSYSVFKQREQLQQYFRRVRRSLLPGGMFFLDAFGGTESIIAISETRRIAVSTALDGSRVSAFTYVWEQARFNPIDHHIVCHIHFKLGGGIKLNRAFTYDWRLWTLPELRELLLDSGFEAAEVYVEGWDEKEEDTDGIYRRRTRFENDAGWVAYVIGLS